MNFKQLVLRNVLRNGRAYASYFLSSLFSVMVFFVFALLYFHPELKKPEIAGGQLISELANVGILVSQVVVVLMSLLFLWYTFSLFLKSRKRDFAIYLFLGMSEKKLKKMLFLENVILGSGAIVSGIIVSTIFSKLILLVTQNILVLEQGMPFYLPIKPIVLTAVIYGVIFVCIAIFTTFRIQTENLSEMSKAEEKPLPEPKTKGYLAVLSLVLLAAGYGLVVIFSFLMRNEGRVELGLLLACVLLTIAGTYLFFSQSSVRFLANLKKRPLFLKQVNLLTISNLVYRMKTNAVMYFMIGIVASVAFVGIGVTMAIGGSAYAGSQASSFAYVYTPYSPVYEDGPSAYHTNNVAFIEETIREAGYEPSVLKIVSQSIHYGGKNSNTLHYAEVIPLSIFNKLAKIEGGEPLTIEDDQTLLVLGTTNSSMNTIKSDKELSQLMPGVIHLTEEVKDVAYRYVPRIFNINSGTDMGVVSDELFEAIKAEAIESYQKEGGLVYREVPTYVIHYPQWAKAGDVDRIISPRLDQQINDVQSDRLQFELDNEDLDFESLSPETEAELEELDERYFWYESLYTTWIRTKQNNGLILLISVLLGSVFFAFAACIIYFRLFGELDRDGNYHRSLHIVGVSQKVRHQIVTREMLVMYFVPVIVAIIHFSVAMSCLKIFIELPVWQYVMRIVFSYVVFQLVFFAISRWRYLKHLDLRAEKN